MLSGQFKVVSAVLAVGAAIVLTGCGAGAVSPAESVPMSSALTAAPGASDSASVPAVAGCWVPGSGLATCGDLVSVSGLGPDGVKVDLTSLYRLSSPGLTEDGLTQLYFAQNGSVGCLQPEFNVPVSAQGDQWVPDDSRMFTPATGCAVEPTSSPRPNVLWIQDMFGSPMVATFPDAETVRIGSADAGNPVFVDFRWA